VQTIMPLGRNGAMKLTTQRYYTPSGRSIQAKGIEPDILVTPSKVEPLDQRKGRSEKDLRGSLKNNQANKADKAENSTPETTRPFDYQLVRALALLRGISLYRGQMEN
jgi:carboxyl-terminal processing protease